MNAKPIGVWDFGTKTDELGALAALADGRRHTPDHRVIEVTRYEGHLDVLLESGALVSSTPGALFFVEGRGAFRLLETLTTATDARTVLRLAACSVVEPPEARAGPRPGEAVPWADRELAAVTEALNELAARLDTGPDELVSAAGRRTLGASEW